MYLNDRASRHLGIDIAVVRAGHASARMAVTADMVNGHDVCHGGYLFLLADSAFAFACNGYDIEAVAVAASCDIDFVAPAYLGDHLVATATEVVRQGRSGVYDVVVARQVDGEPIALFRGRSRTAARRHIEGPARA